LHRCSRTACSKTSEVAWCNRPPRWEATLAVLRREAMSCRLNRSPSTNFPRWYTALQPQVLPPPHAPCTQCW
jgi:hypothetical protein